MFRVGAARYRVVVEKGPLMMNGRSCVGTCDQESATIRIANWVKRERRLAILLHELAHAHMFATGLPSTEEQWCDFISTVAETAFRDLQACGGEAALKRIEPGETLGISGKLVGLTRARACQCGGLVAPGDVMCVADPDRPDHLKLSLYCEHCDITLSWHEMVTFGGLPSGVVVGEPTVERGNTLIRPCRLPSQPASRADLSVAD